jgi:hypothetical protein
MVYNTKNYWISGLCPSSGLLNTTKHKVSVTRPVSVHPLKRTNFHYVRFEVFTAVTIKNGVFWDVTPCGSCKNRRFGGTWRLLHQGEKNL